VEREAAQVHSRIASRRKAAVHVPLSAQPPTKNSPAPGIALNRGVVDE
jgi:hypothetical protein